MTSHDGHRPDHLTSRTVELLQTMIRNECVNDGRRESGHESRNADVLESVVSGPAVDLERFEPVPGRASLVARIAGSDPTAPSLCLMGHTDVVPVHADGWSNDPFGGELIRSAAGVTKCGGAVRWTCSTSPRRWRSRSATSLMPRDGGTSGRPAI